jgi:hypothetical protein
MTRLLTVAVSAAVLGGCGGTVSATFTQPAPTSMQPVTTYVPAAPNELVGTWRVSAEGEAPSAAIQIGRGLTLLRDCGLAKGQWRATPASDIVLRLYNVPQPCGGSGGGIPRDSTADTPAWMVASDSLGRGPEGLVLLDASGVVTAELTRVPAAEADGETTLLGVDPDPDAGVDNVVELPPAPAGLSAEVGELAGMWMYPDPRAIGRLTLDEQGRERYFDGCNASSGFSFRVPLGDGVISMPGVVSSSTLKLCSSPTKEGTPGPWLWAAPDGTLVFTDDDGGETGRFVRVERVMTGSAAPMP